jgi:hypothetical protein
MRPEYSQAASQPNREQSQFVAIFIPIMLASVAFFIVIERPCMDKDWPSKLTARSAAEAGSPAIGRPFGPIPRLTSGDIRC